MCMAPDPCDDAPGHVLDLLTGLNRKYTDYRKQNESMKFLMGDIGGLMICELMLFVVV